MSHTYQKLSQATIDQMQIPNGKRVESLETGNIYLGDGVRIGGRLLHSRTAEVLNEHISFNEITGRVEVDVALESTLDSIYWGKSHSASAAGSAMFYENLTNGRIQFHVGGYFLDQSIPANQGASGKQRAVTPVYSDDLLTAQAKGPITTTAQITDYAGSANITFNISNWSTRFRSGELITAGSELHYQIWAGSDNTGISIFNQTIVILANVLAGDFYEFWWHHPAETLAGDTIYAEITVHTNGVSRPLQVYALESDPNNHWNEIKYLSFEMAPLVVEDANGDVVIPGNFTVLGATTTILSEVIEVADKNIVMGATVTPTDITADGGGITLRGLTDKLIIWENATDSWHFNQSVHTDFNMIVDGNIGVGLANPAHKIHVSNTLTNASAGSSAMKIDTTADLAVSSGGDVSVINALLSSISSNPLATLSGIDTTVSHIGAGLVTTLNGSYTDIVLSSVGTATTVNGATYAFYNVGSGVVTNYNAINIEEPVGATTVNSHGVHIADMGGVNPYGIYQTAATNLNYFAGNVGIGTDAPVEALDVVGNIHSTTGLIMEGGIQVTHDAATPFGFALALSKSFGGAATRLDDVLGSITFTGHNGLIYTGRSALIGYCDGVVSAGSMPTRLDFLTTPVGSLNGVTQMTIKSDGKVGIGTSSPDQVLHVVADVNGSSRIKISNPNVSVNAQASFELQQGTNGAWVYFAIQGEDAMQIYSQTLSGSVVKYQSSGVVEFRDVLSTITDNSNLTLSPKGTGNVTVTSNLHAEAAIFGGSASGNDLLLRSTTHATRGKVFLGISGNVFLNEVTHEFQVNNLNLAINTLSTLNINGDLILAPNGTGKVSVTKDLVVTKFTSLGSDAPKIKQKKLSGVVGGLGSTVVLAHGLTLAKILSVEVLVTSNSGSRMPPEYSGVTQHQYSAYTTGSGVQVQLSAANAANLEDNAVSVLITYEE